MAAVIDAAPWFVELQRYKPVLFGASGLMLALNYWMVVVRPRRCAPGELCHMDTPFMRFNRRLYWFSVVVFAVALLLTYGTRAVYASGHGPLFGAATPTLGKGGWQFDQAWMGQVMKGPDSGGEVLRTMISAGLTEKIQLSVSAPIPLETSSLPPSGRMMSMMSFNRDVEVLAGWRFQVRPVGTGARAESTVYVGGTVPLVDRAGGLATAPAAYVALTSGYASRSHYFWAGGSYQHPGENDGDRMGRVASASVVYGYRPPAWRLDYPKPDLRLFVESVFDSTSPARHAGAAMADTGGRVALVGPSMLLLYKAYGLEGGILFPVYQRMTGNQPDERFRFGVNFTYFFWPGKPGGH
jgi:hypothetical protein